MKRIIALLLVASGALLATRADAEPLHVGTPAGANFTFLPARIGADRGAFTAEGLDVEVTDFGGGAKLQQAMISSAIDMTVSAGTDLAFSAKGSPDIAVAAMGSKPTLGIVVAYDSPLKNVEDLKGKKVGVTTVGSLTEWLMKRLIAQRGWPKDAVTLVPVGSDLQSQAALLTTGQIDGVVAPPAFGVQLELAKKARILLSGFDIGKDFLGEAIFASNQLVQSNPAAIRRFLKAWFQNIAWMRAHKDEAVELARKYTHYTPEVESKEYDLVMPIFSPDGKFHPAALQTLAESFIEMGTFDHTPDLAKFYTESYLPN
ncbi:MAG TPA: ABC transporter substrate-binding protein [Stellaceae bacterium]|jgi:ABC-type nitrate/sulfonate/bicarbonate transport system substrate-binding protein